MGREIVKSSVAELPLWQRYVDQFPVRDNLLYLNHAAVAPLPRTTADEISAHEFCAELFVRRAIGNAPRANDLEFAVAKRACLIGKASWLPAHFAHLIRRSNAPRL